MRSPFSVSGQLRGRDGAAQRFPAMAGQGFVLKAGAVIPGKPPADLSWEVDGQIFFGDTLKWIPNRPGVFPLNLRQREWLLRRLEVAVSLRPADLLKAPKNLDCFFCIVVARWLGAVVLPVLDRKVKASRSEKLRQTEVSNHHPAFAKLMKDHTLSYKTHSGLLPAILRSRLPTGLYAVFSDDLAFLGTNAEVLKVTQKLEEFARIKPGLPFSLGKFEKDLYGFDITKVTFLGDDIPADEFSSIGESSIGARIARTVNTLTAAASDFAKAVGTGLDGKGGLGALFDFDVARKSVTTRLFGAGGQTRFVESTLGGFLGKSPLVFDLSSEPKPVFKASWMSEQPDGGKSGGKPWGPSTGWEKQGPSGWKPYEGNPRETGEVGKFRNVQPDGPKLLYEKGGDTSPSASTPTATDGGTPGEKPDGGTPNTSPKDGGSDDQKSDEEKLFQLDEDLKNTNTGGGTTTPANIDTGQDDVTAEDIRWAIITRGGGLVTDPSPDAGEEGTGGERPIIPGGGYTDPVNPDFFYEWAPTIDEERIPPRPDAPVTDPVDEETTSAWPIPIPNAGPRTGGTPGTKDRLVKTTTFHGDVMIESFSGLDARQRPMDRVVGGVHIVRF